MVLVGALDHLAIGGAVLGVATLMFLLMYILVAPSKGKQIRRSDAAHASRDRSLDASQAARAAAEKVQADADGGAQ